MDRELVTNMVNKIEYPALLQACQQLAPQCSSLPELPAELPEVLDDALVASLHTALFDIHVTEGNLICPSTGRKFTIKEGRSITILYKEMHVQLTSAACIFELDVLA